jgi:hypothetical protein
VGSAGGADRDRSFGAARRHGSVGSLSAVAALGSSGGGSSDGGGGGGGGGSSEGVGGNSVDASSSSMHGGADEMPPAAVHSKSPKSAGHEADRKGPSGGVAIPSSEHFRYSPRIARIP